MKKKRVPLNIIIDDSDRNYDSARYADGEQICVSMNHVGKDRVKRNYDATLRSVHVGQYKLWEYVNFRVVN